MARILSLLLGVYDCILAIGSILLGIMMISQKYGIFIEYPEEWLAALPFKSWVIPGFIGILVFGIGNILAAVNCFNKEKKHPWFMSMIMGIALFISLQAQIIILGEWYLVTVELMILCIIQIVISGFVLVGSKKRL